METPPPLSIPPLPAGGKTGLASASLTLGLLGVFCGLTSFFAIVFGHIALYKRGKSPQVYGGRGRAVCGTILGYLMVITWAAFAFGGYSLFKNPEFRRGFENAILVRGISTPEAPAFPVNMGDGVCVVIDGQIVDEDAFLRKITEWRTGIQNRFGAVSSWVIDTDGKLYRFPQPTTTAAFNDSTFQYAFEDMAPGVEIVEFVPAGQAIDDWLELVSVQKYGGILIADFLADLDSRIVKNEGAVLGRTHNDGVTITEFALPDQDGVEYNMFRLHQIYVDGTAVVVCQQYAAKYNGKLDDVKSDGFGKLRKKMADAMLDKGLQLSDASLVLH